MVLGLIFDPLPTILPSPHHSGNRTNQSGGESAGAGTPVRVNAPAAAHGGGWGTGTASVLPGELKPDPSAAAIHPGFNAYGGHVSLVC